MSQENEHLVGVERVDEPEAEEVVDGELVDGGIVDGEAVDAENAEPPVQGDDSADEAGTTEE